MQTAQELSLAVISHLQSLTRLPHSGNLMPALQTQLLWLRMHCEMVCRPEKSCTARHAMPQTLVCRNITVPNQEVRLVPNIEGLLVCASRGLLVPASLVKLLWPQRHCGIYCGLP